MGVLNSNIITERQLGVEHYFDIFLPGDEKLAPLIKESMFEYLNQQYAKDPLDELHTFYSIYNDLPEAFMLAVAQHEFMTDYTKSAMSESARRCPPFWGVPEVPAFNLVVSITRQRGNEGEIFYVTLINKNWEMKYKGIDPKVYDLFIRYMRMRWMTSLPCCRNINPEEVIASIQKNPNHYADEVYIDECLRKNMNYGITAR